MFIRFATCYVNDQSQALAFYEKLGFEKTMDEEMGAMRWLTVAPPGAPTGLTLFRDAERAGSGSFVVQVDDINATYTTWTEIGIEFAAKPEMQPWGMMQALLDDPDGNRIVLVAMSTPRS
jgi:predicted enzyme related to lactoylglutathione lyase